MKKEPPGTKDNPGNLFNQGCKALDDSEYPKNVCHNVCELEFGFTLYNALFCLKNLASYLHIVNI